MFVSDMFRNVRGKLALVFLSAEVSYEKVRSNSVYGNIIVVRLVHCQLCRGALPVRQTGARAAARKLPPPHVGIARGTVGDATVRSRDRAVSR